MVEYKQDSFVSVLSCLIYHWADSINVHILVVTKQGGFCLSLTLCRDHMNLTLSNSKWCSRRTTKCGISCFVYGEGRSWKESLPATSSLKVSNTDTFYLAFVSWDGGQLGRHLDCHTTKRKANCCIPGTLANGEAACQTPSSWELQGKQPQDLCLSSSLAKGPKKGKNWPDLSISLLKIIPLAFSKSGQP